MPPLNQLPKLDSINGNKSEKNVRLQDVEAPRKERDTANKKYVDGAGLKNKTSYLSIPAYQFKSADQEAEDISYAAGRCWVDVGTPTFVAPVILPQGAIITGAVVYGDDAAETWTLLRATYASPPVESTLATANINTEDVTISNATVDNSTYTYYLTTSVLDTADEVHGARIKYTTDYD